VPDPAWWSTLLGQLALIVCITLILVATLGGWLLDRRLRAHGMSGRARLASDIAYVGLLLIILNTF
jgi:prenyltransferase beta subunit